ncbi:MAG: GNAT family N-acetyltransferase [Gemmatimonadota bacterium]|jgi:predicted acetyltransferase
MSPDRIDIHLQPAGEQHIPAMAALWAEAFPEKPQERRTREIREGFNYGDLTDCWIVEDEDRLAGALRSYRLTLNLWGRKVPVMGLAGVAVAPDFRRRGIGRRMCLEALRIARDRGDVLSALFPFRTSFYRDMGFALAGAFHRYRFNPASLPLYPGWDHVVRAPEEGRELARQIYGRVAERSNGLLERSSRMWTFLELQGAYLYLYRDIRGNPAGYVVVRGRGGPPERSRLRVLELVAETREAYLGLLGWLSVQRDQWGTIVYDSVPGEDFYERLAHPRSERSGSPRGLWFHSASILRGPMFRILNLEAFFRLNGAGRVQGPSPMALSDGTVQIRDPEFPENQGSWRDGERVASTVDPTRGPIVSIGDVVKAVFRSTLPGQPLPPEGWEPNLGLTEVRMLDEF